MPSAPLALWVLGCFSLLLWLWALCTACHRYVPGILSALTLHGSEPEVTTEKSMYFHTKPGPTSDYLCTFLC